jgi:bla regulator protein blaR1
MKKFAGAGMIAAVGPLSIGIIWAQTLPPPPAYTYEVASVRPSSPGQSGSHMRPGTHGGLQTQNTSAMVLLTFAYNVRDYQIIGAPRWVSSEPFDINFTPDQSEVTPSPGMSIAQLDDWNSRSRQRMQAVLRDRFGLVLRIETRELPAYALTLAKGGHKLSPPVAGGASSLSSRGGQLTAHGASIKMLTDLLSSVLGYSVTNATGLDGAYDFKLQWTPDSSVRPQSDAPNSGADSGADSPSIFTALTEQLGLRLESRKEALPVYVIEKIDKPSKN